MEIHHISLEICTLCAEATSFPNGVLAAHKHLHSLVTDAHNRRAFGISWGKTDGGIVYKAAVEESYPGEGKDLGCPTFVIPAGMYMAENVANYMQNPEQIGTAFQRLLATPNLDPQGFCLEIYLDDSTVQCLVKLRS